MSTSEQKEQLFVKDFRYGRFFLVDSGSQKGLIPVPIIGADFLCANDLLVDVANHHLIDAMSFATFPCQTGHLGPLHMQTSQLWVMIFSI